MDKIFKPYFDQLIVYIDDVLIFSKNIQDHFKHVHTFKQLVKHNGLVLSKKKIEVFQSTIKFLGHTIFNGQISLRNHVLEFAGRFLDVITDKNQLQRFLGCLNYVSNFYQDCATDRSILNKRLKKKLPQWTKEHTRAIQNIKYKVKSLPILYVSNDNAFKIVETYSSNIGQGGTLKKRKGDTEQVVQYAYGTWNPAEKNNSTIEKEVKVAWNCLNKLDVYLINRQLLL